VKLKYTVGRLFAIACSVFYCSNLTEAREWITFWVFQQRDLHRALGVLAGQPIFFGPEMTGGGNLPGPLYYYLLAFSLWLKPVWESAWLFELSMFLGAALIGWMFFRKQFSWILALVFITLFFVAPDTRRFTIFFLNVSYMIPFTVASLVLTCLAVSASTERARARSFLGSCFITGCALQFHFSVVVLLLALLFMWLAAAKLKLPRVSLGTLGSGLVLFTLPSLPYLAWLARGSMGGQVAGYPGSAEKSLPVLMQLLADTGNIPLDEFLHDGFQHFIQTIPFALLILSPVALWLRSGPGEPNSGTEKFKKPLWICAAFSFPPFLYWFFVPIGNRYGQPFYLSLIFLTVTELNSVLHSRRRLKVFNLVAGTILCAYVVFCFATEPVSWTAILPIGAVCLLPVAVAYWSSPDFRRFGFAAALAVMMCLAMGLAQTRLLQDGVVKRSANMMPRLRHWTHIWGPIYRHTGWSWDEAIHRTYFIGHHIEQDAQSGYEFVIARAKTQVRNENPPDGFFVDFAKNPGDFDDTGDAVRWMLEQNISEDLKDALRAGDIRLEDSLHPKMLIMPYRTVKSRLLPAHFHDYGEAYLRDPDESLLDEIRAPEAAIAKGGGRFVFKWNECPETEVFCSTGALVELKKQERDSVALKVRVIGQAISQVSPWISPNWTEAWNSPYVELKCGGEIQRFKLASSIGYRREYANETEHLHLRGNNSIVAPFEREFSLPCKGKPQALTVGRESSTVETIYRTKELPGKPLTLKL